MKIGAYKDLEQQQKDEQINLGRQNDAKWYELLEKQAQERERLRAQCLAEHRSHEDAEGKNSGTCARCGWSSTAF